jgi:crotonobetainyl-CoA:carnitine CoA-transferase CaiB-like acyl-CoA transferase
VRDEQLGDEKPCAGITIVEVAVGVSDLGLGLAGGLPGMLLAELGADVVRVVGRSPAPIDADLPWGQVWHRDKRIVEVDAPAQTRALIADADVVLAYGPESLIEQQGLGYRDLRAAHPALVYARCRPSRTGSGTIEDFGLVVDARAGFCGQLAGHRPGPIFVDAHASGIGAAFVLLTSVLALLRRRVRIGVGGWAETSLYDGLLATLGCMIGRSERAAADVEHYWEQGSTYPNFLYRCADGELIQVWFGGKGMYESVIRVLGDEPSANGYYTDQATGKLGERATRWQSFFATGGRDEWIERLRAAGVACEPVYPPGQVLAEGFLGEIGLSVRRERDGRDEVMIGSPLAVRPRTDAAPPDPAADHGGGTGLLAGLRVLDFSAFVAGPLAAQVLADLGADVVKVEPPQGEAMRAAAYAVAACQRGKRSVAVDINAPEARPVLDRLIAGSDVVLHNFRVGVAERIGIGADTVARRNPGAVFCHASAFGDVGARAAFPGNDALMQALTGFEHAIGGADNDPIAATWIPIDMAGGWLAATGILAGLLARATQRRGQTVVTSLLGAGMLPHSGVFRRAGGLVRGPELDTAQTGYGPGYRIYRAADDNWFALVLPDPAAWRQVAALPGIDGLPGRYAPLRGGSADVAARQAESVLESAFATRTAAAWVELLRAAGAIAEPIEPMGRDAFRRGILDDPVNRQLGRVASYPTADWGHFEQIGPLLRCGPEAEARPPMMIPGVGEHTVQILTELGFDAAVIDDLLASKVVRQLDPP